MIRDAVVFRSIPLVTSGLAFLPACGGDGNTTGDDDDSTGSPTSMTAEDTANVDDTSPNETSSDDASTLDDSTSTSSATATDDTTDSGDPQCGTGTCGATPPIGWFGPTVYARVLPGDLPPPCPEEWNNPGPTVLEGFTDPGPAVCGCECELSAPQTCISCMETAATQGACTPNYYYGNCPYNNTDVTDDCTNVNVLGWVGFTSDESNYYGGGGSVCEETATEAIPPFQFDAQIATCRIPESALACDAGVCIPPAPEGFESKWCIYQQGDIECPAGEYPNKTIFWSDVDDTRGCTNCQCGTAAEVCTERQLMIFNGPDCAGDPAFIVEPDGVCVQATGGSIAGTPAESGCPVNEPSMPQGEIMPTGAFTFCCSE
jgi:hypothetical protein